MDTKLIFILLILGALVVQGHILGKRQTPTPNSDESETENTVVIDEDDEVISVEEDSNYDDEDECQNLPERAKIVAELFPEAMSREQTLKMLKRAVDMMEKPTTSSKIKRPCRQDAEIDIKAKNTLRFFTGDPTIGSTSSSSQASSAHMPDEEFCPEVFTIENNRRISDSTIKKIIDLKHNKGYSEKSISAQYPWFRRQYLPRMEQYVTVGLRTNVYDEINRYVLRKVDQAFAELSPVHDYHLRQWGFDRADELNATEFKASNTWLSKVKRLGHIVGRKVTKYKSRSDIDKAEDIERSRISFGEDYNQLSQFFPRNHILNVDQSGHKYEISNIRSLGRQGSRNHELRIDSANKNTHSYTIQPIIGRDGMPRGRLLICFREPKDNFGPEVTRRVRNLEAELGNIVAVASSSGKMSGNHTRQWVQDVLLAAIDELDRDDVTEIISTQSSDATEIAGPSWASQPPDTWTAEQQRIMSLRNMTPPSRPHTMVLLDAWGGHSSEQLVQELSRQGIFIFRIPPGTTDNLQPLDVQIFRQYKIFIKRVMEAASYHRTLRDYTDRYGIMRMHSVIWNQMQAPIYRDMFLWAWRKTDPAFDRDELVNEPPPDMVEIVQFGDQRRHACHVANCTNRAFIQCAHCRKYLCHEHFLARKCFHEGNQDFGNATSTRRPGRRDDGSDGSGGAAGATGVVGLVAGTGVAAAVGSSAAIGTSGAIAGSIGVVGSASSGQSSDAQLHNDAHHESVPLLVLDKPILQRVEVISQPSSLDSLIITD